MCLLLLRWHAVRVVLLISCYKGTIKWANYKRKSHFLFYFRMPVPKRCSRRGTIKWVIYQVSVVLLLTIIIKVFKMIGLFNYYCDCVFFLLMNILFFLSKAIWLLLWINSLYMLLVVSERQIKAFFGHVSLHV